MGTRSVCGLEAGGADVELIILAQFRSVPSDSKDLELEPLVVGVQKYPNLGEESVSRGRGHPLAPSSAFHLLLPSATIARIIASAFHVLSL